MMTRDEFDIACSQLTRVVTDCGQEALKRHGFGGVRTTKHWPKDYNALKKAYHFARYTRAHYFLVMEGHCDNIIYDSPSVNYLYRAWHDLTHIELNRGFGYEDELIVARYKSLEIPPGPMREIMLADAVGETEFAEATGGKFPRWQRDFAFDYVNLGSDWAIKMHRDRAV